MAYVHSSPPVVAATLAPTPARGVAAALPLLVAAYAYLVTLYQGHVLNLLLLDGDTYWHVRTGQWILEQGTVPTTDIFSHTRPGAPWTAHEWLADVVMALAHGAAGWNGLVAISGIALAVTLALLTSTLLKYMQPARVLLLAVLAMLMTAQHLLARPHILAMPLLLVWTIGLMRASEDRQAPSWWLLVVIALWANMHGGFTLGLALAGGFALEAVMEARRGGHMRVTLMRWAGFLAAATVASMLTPHGWQGILFTWQMIVEQDYMRARIGEWASPNFHNFQPLMFWLLLGAAVVLHQGLRLPAMRLVMLLALVYLGLKHIRNVELVGLLSPLLVASSFGAAWRMQSSGHAGADAVSKVLGRLVGRSTRKLVLVSGTVLAVATFAFGKWSPAVPPAVVAPVAAIEAARASGAVGPVLNGYAWGGWLIHEGTKAFIDGRADMYGDAFLKRYLESIELRSVGAFESLLSDYQVGWTLLPPDIPANALLARMPGWRRVHADDVAVVYVRNKSAVGD